MASIYLFKKIKEPELRLTDVWIENKSYSDLKIWTYAIDDEIECEKLLNSLDFPDWDIINPFSFILKIKTEPSLKLLNGQYFDENILETESGIYLIRINQKGLGMTLCFLDILNQNFIEITKLKSLSWEIKNLGKEYIELEGHTNKEKNIIQIKNCLQHPI